MSSITVLPAKSDRDVMFCLLIYQGLLIIDHLCIKETKSATMNIFLKKIFLFKSFVKAELSYVFTINLFTIAENCMKK